MTRSHYRRNTSPVVYLLFCLIVASASASSFIRQFTDGFNTNLQQNGVGPMPNQDKGNYLHNNEEISSRDYKVSASNVVKGLRDHPPSSYSLKMESFNTLLKSTFTEKYESRPFSVGGYNWTLVVYPNGNKKDSGSGYLSLYVAIDNSTLVAAHQEVYADLRFYIFNKNERKYFTIQDTDVWKFNVFKTMWGFSQVLSIDTFKDPKNGYLYDGDHCEFGVDVTIPSLYKISELFTVTENFHNPRFTWSIRGFSMLLKDSYLSDVFSIGGRNWNIQVYPNGDAAVEGKALSMFLNLDANEKFSPYEKIYVRAKLRILNQLQFNNVEKQLDVWYNGPGYSGFSGWGYNDFISLSDLKDSSKGFVVNDVLMAQVEMEAISSTKYFPN
ncbi:probable inactive serine/threonine-protein kinase fnkC isoform X2 [Arabidopsis lyrata subsp. lyrata]|uniref:probable inactive serine/threonine-protein kinase fnkC isoform X2 n=1 Tax=Arabidopsis lyrata subsp. lyrata TaxID=81972 RepID=UPI000A29DEDC|nr:probable inactive serine/threonine-protein kinase fnkC isoform X2 [Arabidopsis lyrata subsp. lyrata]|eukprot:XP_020869138.1 probable inactive serine/threonine-protein kinase fnkC isoform X2 [Arabidopsis lyrata subsp. lyrata]